MDKSSRTPPLDTYRVAGQTSARPRSAWCGYCWRGATSNGNDCSGCDYCLHRKIVDDIRKLGNLSACSFASLEKSSPISELITVREASPAPLHIEVPQGPHRRCRQARSGSLTKMEEARRMAERLRSANQNAWKDMQAE